jgi:cobalt-zinc-cadmium efflux system outer membrane protein
MTILSLSTQVFLCITVILSGSRLQAQDAAIPPKLDLQDAIRLVIARNPALAAARNEVQALEGDALAAGKRLNPAISLEMEDYPIRENPGPFFSNQGITLRFDYEIERGGRRLLRTEAARHAIEAQNLVYKDRVRRIELEVKRTFSRIVLANSNLDVSRLILEQAERMIELNRVRLKQGDISALDLSRIEVERLRFQDDVFQADLMLRNAKSSLLALLNAPDLSMDVDVVGTLPVDSHISEPGLPPRAPLNELRRIALEKRPDLLSALREKNRADTETRLQRAIRSSNITVGGGYKRNLNENSYVLGVTVPLKIFDRNEGGILRADAEQRRAANLESVIQKEIELEVQQAYNSMEINRQRVEYIRTQHLKKAEEAGSVTLASYNLGGATLIDYLDSQRAYRDALRIYNQALFDERISLYELASAIGSGVE